MRKFSEFQSTFLFFIWADSWSRHYSCWKVVFQDERQSLAIFHLSNGGKFFDLNKWLPSVMGGFYGNRETHKGTPRELVVCKGARSAILKDSGFWSRWLGRSDQPLDAGHSGRPRNYFYPLKLMDDCDWEKFRGGGRNHCCTSRFCSSIYSVGGRGGGLNFSQRQGFSYPLRTG